MDKEFMERHDIEDSIRFYVMLGIVLSAGGNIQNPDRSLKEFLRLLKKSNYDEEAVNSIISRVSESLPTEFREIFQIPSSYMK